MMTVPENEGMFGLGAARTGQARGQGFNPADLFGLGRLIPGSEYSNMPGSIFGLGSLGEGTADGMSLAQGVLSGVVAYAVFRSAQKEGGSPWRQFEYVIAGATALNALWSVGKGLGFVGK